MKADIIWGLLRISMGWIFLWAFLDKTFGLGFATKSGDAWVTGGSPTSGFLTHATKGPFADIFQAMAGSAVVDWLFMLGLLGVGMTLLLGVLVRVSSVSGIAMLGLMYLSALPPTNNPFLDDHIIYIIVLIGVAFVDSGARFGLGRWWQPLGLVQHHPWLQ